MAAKYLLLYPINYCFRKRIESAVHGGEADEAKGRKTIGRRKR
jgi:hypothetical protein